MTVKFSEGLSNTLKPCKNSICKACGLYLNQLPALDYNPGSQIFWLGLSAVQFDEGEDSVPLSPSTRSGALIKAIEDPLIKNINFYKTNLVKCLPLKDGKIRYPLEHEMTKCYPNFEIELDELKPTIVFLLGKQVSSFILKKKGIAEFSLDENFNYKPILVNSVLYVPIHHPSYVLVYKRKMLKEYIKNIASICEEILIYDFK